MKTNKRIATAGTDSGIGDGYVERSACAKVILCGEHAVVYGRPAIALPLPKLRARARGEPSKSAFKIVAPDVGATISLWRTSRTTRNPLARIGHLTFEFLKQKPPRATLTITSEIPVGANLGSGAAVSIACARAIAAYFGRELEPADVSDLAYQVEKLHHGTPSGIDNTVIAYEQPVWFERQRSQAGGEALADFRLSANPKGGWRAASPPMISFLKVHQDESLPLVVADTGISTPTRIPVSDVRAAWEKDRDRTEGYFNGIASLVYLAREAMEQGDLPKLGHVMNANHVLLQQLGVSCKELDDLCDAARAAGALGAKMSGGGRGGNLIALARDAVHAGKLREVLLHAGAKRVIS